MDTTPGKIYFNIYKIWPCFSVILQKKTCPVYIIYIVYSRVHLTIHFLQGTRKTWPCLSGHPVCKLHIMASKIKSNNYMVFNERSDHILFTKWSDHNFFLSELCCTEYFKLWGTFSHLQEPSTQGIYDFFLWIHQLIGS